MIEKCRKCGKNIYKGYYCDKCRKELAGSKPKKSRSLCSQCREDYYNLKYQDNNPFGGVGCMSYKSATIELADVFFSLNEVVPHPRWKLNCYQKQY